jgi:hypothetical protein
MYTRACSMKLPLALLKQRSLYGDTFILKYDENVHGLYVVFQRVCN